MTVAVVSSVYGAYDPVVPPPAQSIDVEWVLVTDGEPVDGWRTIIEPRPHLHPRMAAKVPKCRPDLYTDADVTVWLDAAARIKAHDTIEQLTATPAAFCLFSHPERSTVEAEAKYSADALKYHGLPMAAQVAAYRAAGMPSAGLWAAGCIVRHGVFPRFGERWLAEMARWGWQDQLSLPFVLWQTGLMVSPLPGNLWSNDLIEWSYDGRRNSA